MHAHRPTGGHQRAAVALKAVLGSEELAETFGESVDFMVRPLQFAFL